MHYYALLQKVFEKYKEEFTESLEPLEEQDTIIKRALTEIGRHCGRYISDQQVAIRHTNYL